MDLETRRAECRSCIVHPTIPHVTDITARRLWPRYTLIGKNGVEAVIRVLLDQEDYTATARVAQHTRGVQCSW
jgi:hypothetical protein